MKKALALLLCLALFLAMTPAAFAEETAEEGGAQNLPDQTVEQTAHEPPAEETPPAQEQPAEPEPPADTETPGEADAAEPPESESPEEPAETQFPEEAGEAEESELPAEPEPVRVVFVCTPAETLITVYCYPEGQDQFKILEPEQDGAYLLLPGSYFYDAESEGYTPIGRIEFEVLAETEECTVTVLLHPVEEEPSIPYRNYEPAPLVVKPVSVDPDRRTPTVYTQTDERWAAYPYLYSDRSSASTIAASGCGLLALTNAICWLNGNFVDPCALADFAALGGMHPNGGTSWEFYQRFAEEHGGDCAIRYAGEATDYEQLKTAIEKGSAAICSVPGHIMTIVDYDKELDRFLLLDSSPSVIRGTSAGYVWISQEELGAMPSTLYDVNGVTPRFILLEKAATLRVIGCLDGTESTELSDYASFDVWVDGVQIADDVGAFSGAFAPGFRYRIDDIRALGNHSYLGVQLGAEEGIASAEESFAILSFRTNDCVSLRFSPEEIDAPETEPAPEPEPVSYPWQGGLLFTLPAI